MGKKLFVEVCNAADLMPKDGQGSASPFCTVEFDGQRRKTDTKQKELNPVWNSVVEFQVFEGTGLESETVEVSVYSEKRGAQRKPGFLGRVRVPGRSIVKKGEEALVYYPLEKRSMLSHVKGELGLKVWYTDQTDPAPASEPASTAPEEVPAAAAESSAPAEAEISASGLDDTCSHSGDSHDVEEKQQESHFEGRVLEEPVIIIASRDMQLQFRNESPNAAAFLSSAAEERKHEEPKQEKQHEERKEAEARKDEEKREEPKAQVKEVKIEEPKAELKKEPEPPKERKEEPEEKKPEPKVHEVEEAKAVEKKEEKKEEPKEKHRDEKKEAGLKDEKNREVLKDEKKRDVKRKEEKRLSTPTIVIQEEPKKLMRATTLPSSDFHLKETTPALRIGEKVVTYDLVEKMHYLFIKVVKARGLMEGSGSSYARIVFGSLMAKTKSIGRHQFPEWHEVFAFSKENAGGPVLEVSIWDQETEQFMGAVGIDLQEIPTRVPPDSPLAPQWYRLETITQNTDNRVRGDVMLAVWWGTQADEAFTEAWQSDSGGFAHTRAKVYLSPKLWYLRVNVVEAQEVQPTDRTRFPEVSVRGQLGFQVSKTRVAANRNTNPFWNEDLIFVAAEPFEDDLVLLVQNKTGKQEEPEEVLGAVRISLTGIERRIDHRLVNSRWYTLDRYDDGDKHFHGRLHVRVCFDGGYHVMDESTHYSSCVRPTARQLWKPVVGVLELGIIRGKDVLPMKTTDGRGSTDAYCVAKYGQKWVRTRTVVDNLSPRWNEQYSWEVYDPCTVLTVGMFHNVHVHQQEGNLQDLKIGKVRIRISTLESERVYSNSHPLLTLQRSGVRKLGEIELAVRYSSASILNVMNLYFKPLLPKMHYSHPLGVTQSEVLRISAMRMVSLRLSRSEPALRQEVVHYMLDSDSHVWSLRRSKVNYFRIMNLLAGPMAVANWFHNICHWKNPVTTILVHILFLILVMYPELVLPTLFLYLAIIGAWHYRYRPRSPASMDGKLSQAEHVLPDELDEEFDPIPTAKDPGIVKARYDRLRIVSARIQNVLGDIATQGERVSALLSWRDPRASGIVVAICMAIALFLYVVPLKAIVVMLGLYLLRHPRFRDPMPSWIASFFRRLPSLADRIL